MDKKYDMEDKDEGEMVDLDNNDGYSRYSVIKIRSQKSCFEKTLAFLKKFYFLVLCILQVMFILFFVLTYLKVDN